MKNKLILFSSMVLILNIHAKAQLKWAKQVSGISTEQADHMVLDDSGYIYVTGIFNDALDFDPGPGNYTLNSNGYSDIFILKLDTAGNFIWARSLGGGATDLDYNIAL